MIGGIMGKALYVDLSSGKIEEKPTDENYAKKYLGGYGLGARMLLDIMDPNVDPLGPDNVLGFLAGPATGTPALFSGRFIVVCKSPVTQTWNDANCGGYFGPEMKKAGYDAIFFTGKSEKPVYLYINDGKAELRDAAKYWGMDSHETLDSLVDDTGESKLRVALIGPAGENLSLMSCVMDDRHRAAARGGLGAVMGSKNLKAIAVRGTQKVPVADPEKLTDINKRIAESIKDPNNKQAAGFAGFGTGAGTGFAVMLGDTPVRNWKESGLAGLGPDMHNLSASNNPQYFVKKYNCANCPLGCAAHFRIPEGEFALEEADRPEYETAAAFGASCGHTNYEATIRCNEYANRAGMDTISLGATVAWAIECFENGLLTVKDTDGIELHWNDPSCVVKMTEAIAKNEGFGKTLALGSNGASKALGGLGKEYLVLASGIELSMHDPRCCPGISRTYQYDPTPGRHTKGGVGLTQIGNANPIKYDPVAVGEKDYPATVDMEILEVGGLCQFIAKAMIPTAVNEILCAVTGLGEDEVKQSGPRALQIRHLFNIREGLRRKDFTISDRAIGKGDGLQTKGPTANRVIENEVIADIFFEKAGWDKETGIPDLDVLKSLGMEDAVAKVPAIAAGV